MEIMIGLHFNMFYQYVPPVRFRCIQQQNNTVDFSVVYTHVYDRMVTIAQQSQIVIFFIPIKRHICQTRGCYDQDDVGKRKLLDRLSLFSFVATKLPVPFSERYNESL